MNVKTKYIKVHFVNDHTFENVYRYTLEERELISKMATDNLWFSIWYRTIRTTFVASCA